uniref:Uncharacterized protein n=1 Tax=Cacopsylla melanoneura TaxID=428564 RepID=A0A8D8X6L5_9HEMI
MAWFFLTLLIVESVHTLNVHEDSRTLLTEDKKEKGIMAEAALRNEDICEDWLHRMQREASIQNLFGLGPYERNRRSPQTKWPAWQRKQHSEFMKTDWQPLEQDNNVQQLPSELMTSGANVDKWKSSIQIKKRKKRAATRKPCPEFRKKIHSEFMKKYWQRHREENSSLFQENRIVMKTLWKKRKEDGNIERQRKISETLKRIWAPGEGKPDLRKQYSERMKLYWADLKAKGLEDKHQWSDKAKKEHSERMKTYWKRIFEGGKRIRVEDAKKRSARMKEYWRKAVEEGRTQRIKAMSENMKAYWKKLKGDVSNKTTSTDFYNIT